MSLMNENIVNANIKLQDENKILKDKIETFSERLKEKDKVINDLLSRIAKLEYEVERLETNWEVAVEDLSKIAELLDLEEGCTIYDIEDKIERLENIINELEKWLEERLEKLDINGYDDDVFNGIEIVLYKLQELKGEDKE